MMKAGDITKSSLNWILSLQHKLDVPRIDAILIDFIVVWLVMTIILLISLPTCRFIIKIFPNLFKDRTKEIINKMHKIVPRIILIPFSIWFIIYAFISWLKLIWSF